MPYFHTKNKTIWSPHNPALEALYNFLEKHRELLEGSSLYENLTEIYENLDEELKEEK
ncbi:hypothetical protein [Bacillus weihaiensis]|uniref:hypothetical protein n=1 Tax=Bacillus weihaiensis TaxID=1547283 RepID=UPI002356B511|nr:hypothetical protein [Bacillus weihaiensis]